MTFRWVWLSLCCLACPGPLASSGGPGEPNSADDVNAVPLAGTIGGKPWKAVSAVASASRAFGDGGERWVDVADHALGCAQLEGATDVFGVLPWAVGAYSLSFARNVTLLERAVDGGDPINHVALIGRVELFSAPVDAGSVAKLRLRARADEANSVEGQIDVVVCD